MKKENVFYMVSTIVVSICLLFLIVYLNKYLNNVKVSMSIQNKRLSDEIEILKACCNEQNPPNVIIPKKSPKKFYKKIMNISAYCPCELCCGKWSDGQTSTGKDAYTKGVAVDPTIIPLGTKIYIPGYGTVIADDVGGAIKGDKLDVRFKIYRLPVYYYFRLHVAWFCF